jgi:hypothetical protein
MVATRDHVQDRPKPPPRIIVSSWKMAGWQLHMMMADCWLLCWLLDAIPICRLTHIATGTGHIEENFLWIVQCWRQRWRQVKRLQMQRLSIYW